MAITTTLIKYYYPLVTAPGDAHGGDIDTSNEIITGTDENIFADVTNTQRVSGATSYYKVFIRNENADSWGGVYCWISQFTPATNDEVSIALGTDAGTQLSEGTGLSYVSPNSKTHGDVLNVGDLIQDDYQAVWIRRIVTAGGDGYDANNFKIACESS